jgi:hypothetical protein
MLSVILSVLSGGTGIKTLVLSKKPPLICTGDIGLGAVLHCLYVREECLKVDLIFYN